MQSPSSLSSSSNSSKLKMWNPSLSWEEAEEKWDKGTLLAAKKQPLKEIRLPQKMSGITEETAKYLKWKSLKWMLSKDHKKEIRRGFFKHPFRYGFNYLRSLFQRKPYRREGDFFLYGVQDLEEFERLLQDAKHLVVVGFSYCHKPFECPSGRFTDACIHDAENSVCRQCFIGKAIHALPEERAIPLLIPTVHFIGGKIFEIVHSHPKKQVLFMITACEMTLEMFGDWGNMVGVRGVGIRLDGRICNTMRAFELSEQGIKPGLTVVLPETQKRLLSLIQQLYKGDLYGKRR